MGAGLRQIRILTRLSKPNFELKEIAQNCQHSGLFPSPGGGKLLCAGGTLYCVHGDFEGGSSLLAIDSHGTHRGRRFAMAPPYLAIDRQGFLHIAGLDTKERSHVLYFRSRRPYDLHNFDAGVPIHVKNYSSLASDDRDGSLYYFGAGVHSHGIAFRRCSAEGKWSERLILGVGRIIYPGVVIRDGVIHLIFCGWTDSAALYQNVYYMRSADGGRSWTRSDGRTIGTPFEWDLLEPVTDQTLDRVSRTFREGSFESNTHNLQLFLDSKSEPHVMYYCVPGRQLMPEPTPRNQVVHARREGDRWGHSILNEDPDLSVWMANITEDSRGRLHCVCTFRREGRKHFDLGYCASGNRGDGWSGIQAITTDADQRGANYMYPHWAPFPINGHAFICSLGTGKKASPLFLGEMGTEGS